jgi:hypothetical protein
MRPLLGRRGSIRQILSDRVAGIVRDRPSILRRGCDIAMFQTRL